MPATRARFWLDPDQERQRRALLDSLTPTLGDVVALAREETYLSTREVSLLLRVNPATVRRWTDAGKLRARRSLGGHRMFPVSALCAVLARLAGSDGASPGAQVSAATWVAPGSPGGGA